MDKIKCRICNKDRDIMAVRINTEDKKNIYIECIECASGYPEGEFLKEQQTFFDSADRIWKQMGVV